MTNPEVNNWRVLLVDDEDDSAEIIEQILAIYGVTEVMTVTNGVECLNMLDEFTPNLVLVDLSMPEMDGWRTLEQIRANGNFDGIRVVAITAYHSAHVANEARRVGFDAYFEKPIDADSFVNGLRKIMV